MHKPILRLTILAIAGVSILLAGCAAPAPQIVPQTIVVPQTVVVPQTQVVEKAVTVTPAPAAPAPALRTINVSVGSGQNTTVESAFVPSVIRIRANDTVQWKVNGDEIHTVSFNPPPAALQPVVPIPGGGPTDLMLPPELGFATRAPGAPVEKYSGTGYVNSGIMSKQPSAPGAPPNDTFALTFDKPGAYKFVCLLHPYMDGVVVVEPATDTTVPSQADIDAQAKADKADLDAQVKAATDWSKTPQSAAGPNNTNAWFVNVGTNVGDPSAALYDFGPKTLTVKAGDTVDWFSYEFHTVTFNPKSPPDDFVVPKPQGANKPPILSLNPRILLPAKPSQTYDPTQYYNSGVLGQGDPAGDVFSLTFDKPGTYEYYCAVHVQLGMKGTIIVLPK
jgi:plastocyanin